MQLRQGLGVVHESRSVDPLRFRSRTRLVRHWGGDDVRLRALGGSLLQEHIEHGIDNWKVVVRTTESKVRSARRSIASVSYGTGATRASPETP
jgi:hypothetical protein